MPLQTVKAAQIHSIADEMACRAGTGQMFSTIHATAVAICANVAIFPQKLGGNFLTLVSAKTAPTASRMYISRPRTTATNHQGTLPVAPSARKIPLSRHLSAIDRKSTRLNSSHLVISYAVFCL